MYIIGTVIKVMVKLSYPFYYSVRCTLTRPLVLLDLDDVLVDFHTPFAATIAAMFGLNYSYAERTCYYASDFLPITKEQELQAVFATYDGAAIWNSPPFPHCRKHLERLVNEFDLAILTARPEQYKAATVQWSARHLPGLFSDDNVFHNGLLGTNERKLTKVERAVELGAIALVDDTRHNLEGCAAHRIQGVLFHHSWNEADSDHDDFIRARGWSEVAALLLNEPLAAAS